MLRHSYQKLKKRYKEKGMFYTIYHGFKYLIFLIRENRLMLIRQPEKNNISCGMLRVVFDNYGVKLYQEDTELTANLGLNVGMRTLTSWTDSSKGQWYVLRQDKDSAVIKNRWDYLPLTLIWHLRIKDESKIVWKIELEAEEEIKIDAKRVLIILNQGYNSWSIHRGAKRDFLPADREIIGERLDSPRQSLNAWPDADKNDYPAIKLKFYTKDKRIKPLAQQLSIHDSYLHLLGIDVTSEASENYYLPGKYDFLYAEIDILKNSTIRDRLRTPDADKIFNLRSQRIKKDTKILLLNLPWHKNGRWGVRAGSRWPHIKDDAEEGHYLPFPFFMAYSASLLKQHGFDVYLIDALAEKIPEDLLWRRIHKISPDLLVIETSTPSLHYDLASAEKLSSGNFRVCLCGPEYNIRSPDFISNYKFINYILIGEYEYNLLKLAECISKNESPDKVKGLLIDIDTLPWPLREGMPMGSYLDTPGGIPLPSVQMLASRGCPFRCKFCLWPQVIYGGNKYRARNIVDVVNEMEYLVKKKGFKSIYFDDDTFNIGKERMLKFCSQIRKRGLENTPWAVMARADLMDEEILTAMKEAGLAAVKYGLESSDQNLLDNCGKEMDLGKSEKMILFTKGLGIKTHLTFTFGLPGETKETIRRTIDYALKLKPHSAQFSITTPFPGTEYFNELNRRGLVIDKDWDDYDGNFKSVIKLDSLSSRDLESARRNACRVWNETAGYNHNLQDDWAGLRDSLKQRGLIFNLQKVLKYRKENKSVPIFKKLRDNYLDIRGIFNGKYAFKGPESVQIDLTDHCNNNCIACWCNSPLLSKERLNRTKHALSKELVKNFITEISRMGTKNIFFSGGGEPFMHPEIIEIVAHAKSLGLSCAINTNFTLVNEKIIQRLIDLGLDNITVSIWAATSKIYKELHPNKDEKDFYHIRDKLLLLNSRKNIYPYVKIYNVICNINYNQIREMLELARATKSDFVEFTVVDTMPNATERIILSPEQRGEVLKQFDKLKEELIGSDNNGQPKIVNLQHFLRRVSNADAQKSEYDAKFIDTLPCYIGWLFARIMPNGDVNSCLKSHRFPIGNLYKQSFKKIWNSKKQAYFRKKTLNRDKDDIFFSLIGNDPNCRVGCYKSCDDIGRNIAMHEKILKLSGAEKCLCKVLPKTGLARIFLAPKR